MHEQTTPSETQAGHEPRPVVYLLVGLTGSGKTTYAQQHLVPAGAVRMRVAPGDVRASAVSRRQATQGQGMLM
ncbi:hypothetical protein [Streptomyces sp. SS52]|uniref:hypothetical protein n=1 Tax=Streptomyces TaxID=1883 RepID=UPI00109EB90E|nr:hypothetical protein [Streptomyces sp. SS52]QCB26673.1 hypothetical protein E5N77_36310 [Streptomyces sp. SS52]